MKGENNMRPIICYDFKSISDTEIVINKDRFKSLIDSVYNAGYDDGKAQAYASLFTAENI